MAVSLLKNIVSQPNLRNEEVVKCEITLKAFLGLFSHTDSYSKKILTVLDTEIRQ